MLKRWFVLYMLILLVLLPACDPVETGPCSDKTPSITWSAYPLRLRVDINGNIDFSVIPGISTPLGTFSIGDPIPLISSNRVLLIIENRNFPAHRQRILYCINLGRSIRVITDGRTTIDVSSEGYVLIDITESRVETIEIYDTNIIPFDPDNKPLCGGSSSMFLIGEQAIVHLDQTSANQRRPRIYTHYSNSGDPNHALYLLQDNDVLELLDGPICYNHRWFWQIRSTELARELRNIEAWVMEAAPEDHYLCPLELPDC
jgi:hypothetical protein